MDTMVTVTKELLEQGLSWNGCLNGAQIKVLGIKSIWHNKGWKSRLIGTQITEQQKKEFLSLTNRHLAHKSRKIPEQQEFWHETYSHLNSIKDEVRRSKTA